MRKKCMACNGSGHYDSIGSPKCTSCKGIGLLCGECGSEFHKEDSIFCDQCGERLYSTEEIAKSEFEE